jgi:hypothetical protein
MSSHGEVPPANDELDEAEAGPPADLSHAGAVVDKAIEYMAGQNISPLAIASALLGGALGMLAHSLDDDAILRVLDNARASVRAGELHGMDGCGRA